MTFYVFFELLHTFSRTVLDIMMNHHRRSAQVWHMFQTQGISQFYLHTHTFIRDRNEPYLPLPAQL